MKSDNVLGKYTFSYSKETFFLNIKIYILVQVNVLFVPIEYIYLLFSDIFSPSVTKFVIFHSQVAPTDSLFLHYWKRNAKLKRIYTTRTKLSVPCILLRSFCTPRPINWPLSSANSKTIGPHVLKWETHGINGATARLLARYFIQEISRNRSEYESLGALSLMSVRAETPVDRINRYFLYSARIVCE